MTTLLPGAAAIVLRRAAVRATLAPSVHNTQPWQLHIADGRLDVFADPSRRLHVLDPLGRQLLISCGCAVMNARVSLAASGTAAEVKRSAHPLHDELVASVIPAAGECDTHLAGLDPVVELRHTNRRQYAREPIPDAYVAQLEAAAAEEECMLVPITRLDHRLAVASLSRRADDIETLNPAYRAELRAWTTTDPDRRDGVPDLAVPRVDGSAADDLPMRDFDTHGSGYLPAATRSSLDQTLLLVCTSGDSAADWARAGEALQRVLLEVTRQGFVASPLTQVIEVAWTRARLRVELGLSSYPQVLLRIGRAAATPTSRRRRLVDVLVDES